jgi:hypothetical protein
MMRFFKHPSIVKHWSGILWGAGIICLAAVTYLLVPKSPNDATALSTVVLAATLGAILWYTFETRALRQQQQQDGELRNHPWLKGSDLVVNRDDSTARIMGMVAWETIYLPVKNVGTTPTYALCMKVQWEMKGQNPAKQEREVVSGFSLAPGDTYHAKLCDLQFIGPGDRATIDVGIDYKSFMGGGGRLKLNFYSHEKGWANGPTSPYEFRLSDGRQFPVANRTMKG